MSARLLIIGVLFAEIDALTFPAVAGVALGPRSLGLWGQLFGRKPKATIQPPADVAAPVIFDELVENHMSTDLITLSPGTSLKEAALTLRENKVTGAPVVEDGRLVGVLSRTDLLYKLAGSRCLMLSGQGPRSLRYMDNTARLQKVQAQIVRDAMTPNPVSLLPSTTMQDAAAIMLRLKLNRLFVANDMGELMGIVSASDVVDLTMCLDSNEDDCNVTFNDK
jgi:CBS domain-containing protein